MSVKPPSKSVFVGNIPYGLTEESIIDIFSSAGKVVSFRLVYDRETGRPKGFGFAEYPDSDSAASAVRNLNDYEIMNRKLRVDFSNDNVEDDAAAPVNYQPTNGLPLGLPPPIPPQNGSILPSLPEGVSLPPGLSCPDAISRTLNTLPPSQLLDVLSQMKNLVTVDPGRAAELLRQAPQLSYAIFQALLLMGLVSADALGSVIESDLAPPAAVPQPVRGPPPQAFPPPPAGFPGNFQPPTQYGTPPVHGMAYPPPPPLQQYAQQQYAPPQNAQPPADVANDVQADLLAQVLAMPQQLVDSLPPLEREQIMALRNQHGLR